MHRNVDAVPYQTSHTEWRSAPHNSAAMQPTEEPQRCGQVALATGGYETSTAATARPGADRPWPNMARIADAPDESHIQSGKVCVLIQETMH